MKKIKIPFKSVCKNSVTNPIEFLKTGTENYVQKEIYNSFQDDSSSENSQQEMSDKEDSITVFSKKITKKRKIGKKVDVSISNLLLKKESKMESLQIVQKPAKIKKITKDEIETDNESEENNTIIKEKEAYSIKSERISDILSDFSLRKEFIIYSKSDFEWLKDKNSSKECIFVKNFLLNSRGESCLEDFYTSLMYFVYPGSKRAPPYVLELLKSLEKLGNSKRNSKKTAIDSYLQEEIEEWKTSFRSVYFMVRNGESRFFYYLNSEFSVLFCQNEQDSLKAYLSSSTVGLRKALEMDAIEFTEKKNNSQKKTWPLEFHGVEQVHGLYDFLLKWAEPRSDKRCQSLPLLYSQTAFLNASLKSSKVFCIFDFKVIRSSKIQSADGDGYRMVIEGILFPESIIRLLDIFKEKNEEYTVTSPVWDVTQGFGGSCFKTVECVNGMYYAK
jgi:hypothetical protein